MQFIVEYCDVDSSISCDACVTGKTKRPPFINKKVNWYAHLDDALSIDTTGPIAQKYIHGNKYRQLSCDASTGSAMGEPMKSKKYASDFIFGPSLDCKSYAGGRSKHCTRTVRTNKTTMQSRNSLGHKARSRHPQRPITLRQMPWWKSDSKISSAPLGQH